MANVPSGLISTPVNNPLTFLKMRPERYHTSQSLRISVSSEHHLPACLLACSKRLATDNALDASHVIKNMYVKPMHVMNKCLTGAVQIHLV